MPVAVEAMPKSKETPMDTDQQRILETILRMGQNYNAGNISAVMTAYEAEPLVRFMPGISAQGGDAVRQAFQLSLAVTPVFSFGRHDVLVAGDIALHLTPWTMKATGPDGSPVSQDGLSIAVLRRQSDGAWRMVIDNPHGQTLWEQRNDDSALADPIAKGNT